MPVMKIIKLQYRTHSSHIRVYCSWFWVVLVGLVGFVAGFGWFWLVLLVVLGGFGWFCWWFWVVLAGFGWFRVLVTTVSNEQCENEFQDA